MRTLFRKLGQIGWSFPVIIALVTLCIAGIFVITSATYTNAALKNAPTSQFWYILGGFAVYLILALIPYQWLVRVSPILYLVGLGLLIGVYIPGLGRMGHGAYSWLKIGPLGFEPAELSKLTYILAMVWFLRVRENQIEHFSTVLWAWLITGIPFILVLKQPALGTASVFFPVCFAMLFAAGVRWYYLVLPLAAVSCLTLTLYFWVHVWDRPIAFMKPFQLNRLKIFFDPSLDPKGSGWQIDQSLIALGSGGMDGKGWGQGTETMLGYLPKNTSYNDLIFPVVGEDFGFRGGAALIICEGTVLLWCLWVAARARDKIGALLAVGVMTMLFTHIFVNIGMTIHLVPITGIPLPFISYGGTFLVACLAAMGLVQSVWVHRKNFERP
jgi:rod shape determining protein RodA